MNTQHCKECCHFYQHYILDEQSCTAINCGHCGHPRLKSRSPHSKACQHFSPRAESAPIPATRHFLTMEILRWVQELGFPPEIRNE